MKKNPILTYLFPLILLIVVVLLLKGGFEQEKVEVERTEPVEKVEKPVLVVNAPSEDNSEDNSESGESKSETKIQSRIPIYPNSKKIALGEGVDINEATFHSTTDSIDDVKDWYIEYLGGLTKVNMIDIVGIDELRKVTLSMPDDPNELVEIKPQFKGSKDLIITITTIDFYTRAQPRSYEPKEGETPESAPKDELNQKSQEGK